MPKWMMLEMFPSSEIVELAAIYKIEDEEAEKANNGKGGNNFQKDNEDVTDDLIAAIDRDREERGL